MITKNIRIADENGINPKTAVLVSQNANMYKADITITSEDGKKSKAKSILGLIRLGVQNGQVVTIAAEGKDSAAAVDALSLILC